MTTSMCRYISVAVHASAAGLPGQNGRGQASSRVGDGPMNVPTRPTRGMIELGPRAALALMSAPT